MKRNLKRILAYVLDFIMISLITYGLCFVSFLNPNRKEINKIYDEVYKLNEEYIDFSTDFEKYFKDEIISDEERITLDNDYPNLSSSINYDEEITSDKVYENLKKNYMRIINIKQYSLSKLSRVQNITLIVVTVLYFIVLQFILKGQTIFKKLLNIKIVNLDDTDAPIWKIALRSLIVNEIIFTLCSLIFSLLKAKYYIASINILDYVKYFLEVVLIFILIVREDGRTLHDLIFRTKVVMLDKDGYIINEDVKKPLKEKEFVEAEIIEEKKNKSSKLKKANGKKTVNKAS